MTNRPGSLSWRARYATNIPTIDAHHQGLFKVLRMLQDATYHGRVDVEVGVILEHLEQHSLAHFRAEEALMQRTGFPGLDSHIQDHNQFMAHLRQLQQRFQQGERGVASEVISTLHGWLHYHILLQDMIFAEHVRVESQL
jgi:hemerythrin-like metal-binding protein